MKFHLVRPALVLASSLVLASCGGGGGKESYPVKVTVFNLQYDQLTLSTNGQNLTIHPAAKAGDTVVANFPNGLDYGTYYNVLPTSSGQPAHQSCVSATQYGYPREYGTAGQTASLESARTPAIEVFYTCTVNSYPLSGTVTGLKTDGVTLTLINGSNGQTVVTGSATATTPIPFSLGAVQYNTSFGVSVLTQPAGYNCTVSSNGTGVMLEAQEKAGGVTDVAVTCTPK
jgi:hypothetical protein